MNAPEKFWKTLMGFIGILAILVIIFIAKEAKSLAYVGINPNLTNSITVEGSGDAFAVPDVATFSFTVTENAKTVTDAQAQATTKTNAAIAAMKSGGVAEKDIQTTSYNINPHYEYQSSICSADRCPPSRSVLTGYDVSESVSVKVRDLTKAGTLLSAIGALSVQNVGELAFSVDNPDAVNAEARAEAIAKAQSKAQELARELGVSLVRVSSFYESNGPVPAIYAMAESKTSMSMAAPAVAPQISSGQQKVTDSVTITYEIK